MTHHEENTAIGQMLEAVIEDGMEGLEAAISILLNEAMKVERNRVLSAEPWQRARGGFPVAGPTWAAWPACCSAPAWLPW